MTYKALYEVGKEILRGADLPEADLDARLLLEFVCGTNRNTLLVHGDREVSAAEEEQYRAHLKRRAAHTPLQHITGTQDFMGLTFEVNEHVLIPRQDTEILVEEALQELHEGMHVLDMCTGSGCILISLLHYTNNCTGVGVDISADALRVAKKNAQKLLGADAVAEDVARLDKDLYWDSDERIAFVQSDLFDAVEGRFDMLVSNPPYIRSQVVETLMPEVKDHEPRLALDGSEDGLFFYREITKKARKALKSGGTLFFEIGYDQGEAVSRLLEENGYLEVRVIKDYAGLDRVVSGVLPFLL
jgi:release factor glutamine methyltransferase